MSRLLRFALAASLFAPLAAHAQPAQAALAHARAAASARGVDAEFVVTDAYRGHRGTDYVYLRQSVAGLEVVGTEATVAVTGRGVAHAPGLDRAVSARAIGAPASRLAAADAASALARHNGLGAGTFAVVERAGGPDQAVVLSDGGVARSAVPARLVWYRGETPALRLAWEVTLEQADAAHWWLGYVDARTGEILEQTDLVDHDTFGTAPFLARQAPAAPAVSPFVAAPLATAASAQVAGYRVYPFPIEAPIYAATTPPADGRSFVSDPSHPTASPQGWHSTGAASYTITRGNNTNTYLDRDDNEAPDAGGQPDGGAALAFDFPLDLTRQPQDNVAASVTNLFYWTNVIHDVLYQYGFTEAAGNFQVNNFGRGGAGNDAVDAESQSGADICNEINPCVNNANFATPADGSRPRMQMYVGTYQSPMLDGAFDNGVVIHEYGHGLSNRLTGGPSQAACLRNAEQMGEGWSDYYAMMLTMNASDTRTEARGMGNYLFGYGTDGKGIRLAPYSTDFAVNAYTYGSTRQMTAAHQIGFVWATLLWEVTWDMIDAHGFSADLYNATGTAGNQVMLQLVTEGMKLQPCSPGFVDGRDGILAADQSLYGGAYAATLQAAFARRGLGFSANQGSSGRTTDNVEAFDLWTSEPPPPPASITLSVSASGGRRPKINLSWSGASGSRVDLLRNGAALTTTSNDGSYQDRSGSTSDVYQVCETAAGGACSAAVSASSGARVAAAALAGEAIDTEVRVAPNPVAGRGQVRFGLTDASPVQVELYNAIGQRVAVLADDTFGVGEHTVDLDASRLPAGVYLYRVTTQDGVQTGSLSVVR